MMAVIEFFKAHSTEIFAVLFAMSEAIGIIPQVKESSVFQVIYNLLKKAAGK